MDMFLLALLIGFVAGLRSMVALAVMSLAAHAGWLRLDTTPIAFVGTPVAVCSFLALAGGELIHDVLSPGQRRTRPLLFGVRLLSGCLCGAAIGGSEGLLPGGAVAGVLGSICGTLVGSEFRSLLTGVLGEDNPAALTEDALAIGAAAFIMAVIA